MSTLVLGAVAYDPKVVTIWEGFQVYFGARGFDLDYVLYANYERQVEALVRGDIDVSWSSPLAWLQAERWAARSGKRAVAFAMRDTDQDLTTAILVCADGPVKSVADLAGRTVAVGASDSPQATLIPLGVLAEAGVQVEVLRHEIGVGKHGDHVGGEREAVCALFAGRADAACVINGNHLAFVREGLIPSGGARVALQTGKYDHCNMTALYGTDTDRFAELLLAMSYDDPTARPLLELEGLTAWRRARTSGYDLLTRAVDRFNTLR